MFNPMVEYGPPGLDPGCGGQDRKYPGRQELAVGNLYKRREMLKQAETVV